jgi:predicted DNA-binding protein
MEQTELKTKSIPRSGYVSFQEDKNYESSEDTVFTLRTKKKLMEDFEKCCKFKVSTKAKIVRQLIENFIEETEKEMEEYSNIVDFILTLPLEEQFKEVSELNMTKDNLINEELNQVK